MLGPWSQPVPCARMYCTRTGLPTALAITAASDAASSASLRPYEPGPTVQMDRTFSTGMPSTSAMPSRTKCGFCEPVQQVTSLFLISTTAQAGPMLACDWNGHSYSATACTVLKASSCAGCFNSSRLRTGAGCSRRVQPHRNSGAIRPFDQASAAWIACSVRNHAEEAFVPTPAPGCP